MINEDQEHQMLLAITRLVKVFLCVKLADGPEDNHGVVWRRRSSRPLEVVSYTKRSPPQAAAVEPSRSNALITFAPVRQRCTSSGPSTRRWDLIPVYHRASGVS